MAGKASPASLADDRDASAPSAIRCARCQSVVTHLHHAVVHAGAHRHTFANPHGYIFRVRCFSSAEGCMLVGGPTRAHSWFPGLDWVLAGCRECGAHLGWGFVNDSGELQVYSLIADQLIDGAARTG